MVVSSAIYPPMCIPIYLFAYPAWPGLALSINIYVLLVEQLGWGGAKALTYFTALLASIEEDENKTKPIWQHCGKTRTAFGMHFMHFNAKLCNAAAAAAAAHFEASKRRRSVDFHDP